MNLDCWGCGKSPPADGPLFLVCPKCRDHKLIKCNFCSQECFKANWVRHEEWHKEQWKEAKRLRKTERKVEQEVNEEESACAEQVVDERGKGAQIDRRQLAASGEVI